MGTTIDHLLAGKALATAREIVQQLARNPVIATELDQAKSELLSNLNKQLSEPDGLADAWLDMDTYGAPSITERLRQLNSITSADLHRAAGRLFYDGALCFNCRWKFRISESST